MITSKPRLYSPRYWLIWLLVSLLWLIVQLPHKVRLAFGRLLGRLTWRFFPKASLVTQTNIQLCFPELSAFEQTELVKKSFESLGMGFIEAMMAWWLPDWRLRRLLTIKGTENAYKAFEHKKGMIALGLHMTSLEISGRLTTVLKPFHAMFQETKSPVIDWMLKRSRMRIYKKIIPNNNVRALIQTLADDEIVWYAPDQSASSKRSTFVPFFNIQTATTTAPSEIARMSGAPVVPAANYRNPDYSGYTIELHPPLENFPSDDVTEDAKRLNQIIDKMIRKHPEQYLWQYKRFKRRPEGEPGLY